MSAKPCGLHCRNISHKVVYAVFSAPNTYSSPFIKFHVTVKAHSKNISCYRNICRQASLVLYLLLFTVLLLFYVLGFLFCLFFLFWSRGMWDLSSSTPCTGLPKEDLFSPSWNRNQYELEVERWGFSLVLPLCNCGKVLSFRPQFLHFSTMPLGKK